MATDALPSLELLAEALTRARVPGLVDLFLERVHEVTWHLASGEYLSRRTLRREGAAVRTGGALRSTDGADRLGIAAMLERPARSLPPLALPPFATPPEAGGVIASLPAGASSLRWRASWSAVVTPDGVTLIDRPPLCEVTLADGQRRLTVWPPPPSELGRDDPGAGTEGVRAGPLAVLLAPAAAAALLHEVVGHALEGDVLLRRDRKWRAEADAPPFALPLDVDDDPSAAALPGAFTFDDEGRVAARRALVRGGAVTGALADVAASGALGVPPGNGRRGGVHAPPRPRMSNLLVRAPLSPLEALRADAAVEVTSTAGASVDPETGAVVLAVRRASALRRGRPHRLLAPFTLRGTVAGVRTSLAAAGGEPAATAEPGWCRKEGEVVATGAFTPWLLLTGLEAR